MRFLERLKEQPLVGLAAAIAVGYVVAHIVIRIGDDLYENNSDILVAIPLVCAGAYGVWRFTRWAKPRMVAKRELRRNIATAARKKRTEEIEARKLAEWDTFLARIRSATQPPAPHKPVDLIRPMGSRERRETWKRHEAATRADISDRTIRQMTSYELMQLVFDDKDRWTDAAFQTAIVVLRERSSTKECLSAIIEYREEWLKGGKA